MDQNALQEKPDFTIARSVDNIFNRNDLHGSPFHCIKYSK